jgi:bis(5'-nucleosyl)-tetraphosphatase (symmetrical)
MARRIFVGDIQGCRSELERLLSKLSFDPSRDQLHPVGDLVNRGPDSLGTLRLLRALRAEPVLGNHDVHLLRVAAGARALRATDTLDELLASDERAELLAWLRSQPFFRAWPDLWLVHAALHPSWADPRAALDGLDPLAEDPRIEFATRARYCAADGRRPAQDFPEPPRPFAAWYEHYRAAWPAAPPIVFGHWARAGLVLRAGLRGLDTGCVWGGQLTAWIAEEDRLVQVRAQRAWAEFD